MSPTRSFPYLLSLLSICHLFIIVFGPLCFLQQQIIGIEAGDGGARTSCPTRRICKRGPDNNGGGGERYLDDSYKILEFLVVNFGDFMGKVSVSDQVIVDGGF